MNAFEIFGLLAVGAFTLHVLLAALLWLDARLMGRRDGDLTSDGATNDSSLGRVDRRDDPDATRPPEERVDDHA